MIASEWYDHRDADTQAAIAPSGVTTNLTFGPVPEGMVWYIERLNTHVSNTHNAIVKCFVDTSTTPDASGMDLNRQSFTAAATDIEKDFISPLVVTPGKTLIVNFSGGSLAQGDTVSATIQRAWCQIPENVRYGQFSRLESQALEDQDVREEFQRENTPVVGASGWAVEPVDSSDLDMTGFLSPWAASEDGQ